MPAKPININLLGQEDLRNTPQGRIVTWALTYGRYIMIGTEIVVLLAFISRFSLDRRLTDLREEITQKQLILEANLPFEQEIRTIQNQIIKVKFLLESQDQPVKTLDMITQILPPDVTLENLEINNERFSTKGVAGTTLGFTQFLNNIQARNEIKRVDLQEVKRNALNIIEFSFVAYLKTK